MTKAEISLRPHRRWICKEEPGIGNKNAGEGRPRLAVDMQEKRHGVWAWQKKEKEEDEEEEEEEEKEKGKKRRKTIKKKKKKKTKKK